MPHGQADFGMYAVKETVAGLSDMAELAARLGSPVIFDRRGDLIWLDDFTHDLTNWEVEANTNETATIVTEQSLNSGFSCKLLCNTTEATLVQLSRSNPLPVTSRLGLEIAFTLNQYVQAFYIVWTCSYGKFYAYGMVYLNIKDGTIEYYDETGEPAVLRTDLNLRTHGVIWHCLKVVFDSATHKYTRLLLDDLEYDMSALGFRYMEYEEAPRWNLAFGQEAKNAASPPIAYVAYLLGTQNEP